MTRAAGYSFESAVDIEGVTDELLEKEVAKEGTPITQYGTDGLVLWLNGRPGRRMRGIVAKLKRFGWQPTRR